MGLIRYKYSFERPPDVEEIAQCFREITGLALNTDGPYANEWSLTASPLRGEVEIQRAGNVIWVVPYPSKWLFSSYFFMAFRQVLHRLGDPRQPRIPRYATKRWADLSRWRRWLHR